VRQTARAMLACAVAAVTAAPLLLAGAATALAAPASPLPGMPRPSANCPAQLGVSRLTGEPWAQQALQFSSVWGQARGQGVTVAVVDSGVDYTPQLAGRVTSFDVTGTGPADCVGHGTAVASIIAASDERADGIPFYGVAPAARILSVKVNTGENGYSSLLAAGIRDAAAAGAGVINVSVQTNVNTAALRSAVTYAQSSGAVVVAAAGNDNPGSTVTGPFYPASYPGVLSVAAVDQTGAVTSYTDTKTPISVAAPGADVASAWPGGFSPANQGTSFAAAFVSGEAALVRSAFPHMPAAQVVSRIEATADGTTGAHSGAGMINPVQAVTAVLPTQAAAPPAGPRSVSVPAIPHTAALTRTVAVSVTGGALAAVVLVVACAVVLPRGRRRGWRPGRADLRAIGAAPSVPGSDWGEEATPRGRGSHARVAGEAPPRSLAPGNGP
jgi:membrane-anchored mycosin MYCP